MLRVGPFNAAGNRTTECHGRSRCYWVELLAAGKALTPGAFSYSEAEAARGNEEYWRVKADFSPNLDLDGDGYARPGDCDDGNAAIHPDAFDIPTTASTNCDGYDVSA